MIEQEPYISYHPSDKEPGKIQAISIMMLVNGILNVLLALGLTGSVVFGSFGVGLLCAPVTCLPAVLGVFEIIEASQLLSKSYNKVKLSNLKIVAICEICCILFTNVISLVVGILVLIFIGDDEVINYLTRMKDS